ncbi:MAG: Hsp20/alpha crystallin family protein [Anaerolineales bacterium]|jgi:HSP20 family protein
MTYYVVPRRYGRWVGYQPVGFNGGRRLPLDVHASSDEFVISAPVPGLKAEDLQIQILEDVVTLRAELQEQEDESESVLLREIPQGGFQRSLRLPAPLDAQHAEAKIENGLLTLRIPKAEEARPKRIEVKAR